MPVSGDYGQLRRWYQDVSGSLRATTATTGVNTLVAARANYTLFVQKIHVKVVTGSAGKTWQFEDSAATPIVIAGALAVDAAGVDTTYDFGPVGYGLTEGKGFNINVSAAGAAGIVTYEAYQKLTAVTSV